MSENEIKAVIILKSRELFLSRGFSGVTTGEIATALGVSKKTMYKYFKTKEDLLEQSIFGIIKEIGSKIGGVIGDRKSEFPEKLSKLKYILTGLAKNVFPKIAGDVRRNAPALWVKIENLRRETIVANFSELMRQGKKEGFLRKDFNEKIFVVLFTNLIDGTINPDALSESNYTADELLSGIFTMFFGGALTEKGMKAFERMKTAEGSI